MFLCKYRDLFGKPGKGLHSYRLGDIAIIDVVGTIVISLAIAYIFGLHAWTVVASAFLLGIFAHWLFCVKTTLNKALGLT